MFQRVISLILVLSTTWSCSVFREKISSKDRAKIKKVAVISDLGDQLQFNYIGKSGFNSKHEEMTSHWKLDQIIEKQIVTSLNDSKKYEMVKVVGEEIKDRPHFDQMITAKRNGAKIKDFLKTLNSQGYDTLIIVQAWKQVEDENVTAGYGIYYDNRLLVHEQNFYLTAKVRVYATEKGNDLSCTDFFESPYSSLDHLLKRKSLKDWPASDIESIKPLLDQKIPNEVHSSLHRLGLI